MILTLNPSRRPSRTAFWCVLGLGALLLPFAPGAARTEAPKEGERTEAPKQTPHAQLETKELVEPGVSLRESVERKRGEEIEKLQDEIDLLRLQVRLKESRLRSAKTLAGLARKRLEAMKVTNSRTPGVIARDEIDKGTGEAEMLTAEAEGKEVELEEARLRLKQAERRLARLQRPTDGKDGDRSPQDKRLRELEQKVENLLREIRDLRRERQPDKPHVPGESSKNRPDDRLWKEVGLRLRSVGGGIRAGKTEFRGGTIVEAIRGASPAQCSGLQVGDILVGLKNIEILSNENVQYVLKQTEEDGSKSLKCYYLRGKELHDGKFVFGE